MEIVSVQGPRIPSITTPIPLIHTQINNCHGSNVQNLQCQFALSIQFDNEFKEKLMAE